MNRLKSVALYVLLPAAASMLVGCGSGELPKEKVYVTRGTVTMNGEPVRFASVTLTPTDPAKGAKADGDTDENGVFQLRTYSNGEPDGAIPGTYKVALGAYDPTGKPPMPDGVRPTRLPKTPLELDQTVEVAADDNDLVIDVP